MALCSLAGKLASEIQQHVGRLDLEIGLWRDTVETEDEVRGLVMFGEAHRPVLEAPGRNLLFGQQADPGMAWIDHDPAICLRDIMRLAFEHLREGPGRHQEKSRHLVLYVQPLGAGDHPANLLTAIGLDEATPAGINKTYQTQGTSSFADLCSTDPFDDPDGASGVAGEEISREWFVLEDLERRQRCFVSAWRQE